GIKNANRHRSEVADADLIAIGERHALTGNQLPIHIAATVRVLVEHPDFVILPMDAGVQARQPDVVHMNVRRFAPPYGQAVLLQRHPASSILALDCEGYFDHRQYSVESGLQFNPNVCGFSPTMPAAKNFVIRSAPSRGTTPNLTILQ